MPQTYLNGYLSINLLGTSGMMVACKKEDWCSFHNEKSWVTSPWQRINFADSVNKMEAEMEMENEEGMNIN